ncbi:tetratricopeptide repeat protein [Caminibacter pacificus]
MAQEDNVIVIEPEEEQKQKKNKLILIIIIVLLLVIIMLLILLAVVVTKKKEQKKDNFNVNQIVKKLEKKHIPKNEINILVKKATILYKSGQKEKALEILTKLSAFAKSLSMYNLGVIKIKEKNYKEALKYFQKAIQNKENRTLSAINAAYCALMLKDYKLFDYYRNLAYTFLPEIAKNKNYPFYYAVVMYYMGYEYESIPALIQPTDFEEKSKRLLGNIYEYYNDPKKASLYVEKSLYKGLDLARAGEYESARSYLKNSDSKIGEFALGLVDLKLSYFKEASRIFKKFANENIYPIKVFLKPSLFEVKTAQKEFQKTFLKKRSDYYDLFFYFAPYKVFNVNMTIDYLKKGIAGIPLNSIEEATHYLKKTAKYSTLNIKIAKAIKYAINGHIYLANNEFQKLIKTNPDSYILHYNLALTYAQLGDYLNAYKHFLRAYHLNPYDLKSGIFALFAADKSNIRNKYLLASVKEDLINNPLEDAMLAIYTNDTVKMAAFAEKEEKTTPMWILTKLTIKALFNKDFTYEALKLKSMFEKDLIANLLYFYASNKDEPIQKLAQSYQSFFMTMKVNLNDFYYGAKIARDWYFEFAKISGLLYRVRLQLLQKAKTETFDIIPVLKRLAYADLFTKHFEESYTIYNDLINNKNVEDAHTMYHAAVAAIGAGHHANAVALMELAKLKNPKYLEARYGLGLLWQEANNLNAASIQYAKIKDGFTSKFFDFNIKNPIKQ